MKVLMTVDAMGGVWTYALELIKALEPDGVTFALATMGAALSRAQREQIHRLPNVELYESTFLLEWMPEPWEEVDRAGEWLLDLEAKFGPQLIHLNGYAHAVLPWRARPLIVAHSCVISWWQAVRREPLPPWLSEYRRRVHHGLHAAATVIAPTRAMLDSVIMNYGQPRHTRVISNGRNHALFRGAAKQPMVASVGRVWDQGKNIHALARVGAHVSWPIYIVGESSDQVQLGAAEHTNIQVLGVLPPHDVAALLARASIYALPARYEPFGLSVLEAACSGCALLLGDVPSLRENWDGAARFVDPYDDDAIRSGLRELIDNEAQRADSSRRAAQRARRFTPEAMAAAYLQTYIELSLETAVRGETCAS